MHIDGELWGARSTVTPNRGHEAIVRACTSWADSPVSSLRMSTGCTHKSGLDDDLVAELHGNVRNSHCITCLTSWPTETVLEWVEAGQDDPRCPECGGIVKTDTIMFGEMLPEQEVRQASLFLAMSDAVLVVGSTVSVWPAADVVMRAAVQQKPIVIINKGATEADHLAAVKIDAGIGEVLPDLVARMLG